MFTFSKYLITYVKENVLKWIKILIHLKFYI